MSNRYITCMGETKTLSEWSKATGIRADTISWRIDKSGWSAEEALTTPVRKNNMKKGVRESMNDIGINRNRSMYVDPTSALGLSGKNAKPGEIWTSRRNDDEYLIIKNHGDFCNTLLLKEDGGVEMIEVQSRAKMYTNPGMLAYAFHSHLGEYVKTLPAMEFQKIVAAISKELDLSFINAFVADEYEDRICELNKCLQSAHNDMDKAKGAIDVLQEAEAGYKRRLKLVADEAEKMKDEINFLRMKLKEAEANPVVQTSVEVEVLRLQAQTYKQMYDELLERIIGKMAM